MIQRIQSLYLLLTTILLATMFFLPLGRFHMPDKTYVYSVYSIGEVGIVWLQIVPKILVTLLVGGALWALLTIFFYKRRDLQQRFCIGNTLVLLAFYVVFIFSLFWVMGHSDARYVPGTGALFPFLALIFNVMALRAIRKDDELVKSLNRIR